MTIEITLEDLIHLTETAQTNGSSIMFVTHTTDGKRATLLVTAEPRKHRARRAAELKGAQAQASP